MWGTRIHLMQGWQRVHTLDRTDTDRDRGRWTPRSSSSARRRSSPGTARRSRRWDSVNEHDRERRPTHPEGHLLVDQLRFMARTGGDRVAYSDLDAGASVTFREWDERSNQLARRLIDHGVAKQDRVALYMDSDHCLQWIIAYAGIHKAGAVVVPVNTRLSLDEVLTILNHAEPASSSPTSASGRTPTPLPGRCPIRAVLATTQWDELDGARSVGHPSAGGRRRHRRHHVHLGHDRAPKGVLVRHRNVAMIPNSAPRVDEPRVAARRAAVHVRGHELHLQSDEDGSRRFVHAEVRRRPLVRRRRARPTDDDLPRAGHGRAHHREPTVRGRRSLGSARGLDRERAARAGDAEEAAGSHAAGIGDQLVRAHRSRAGVHHDAEGGSRQAHRLGRQAEPADGGARRRPRHRRRPARARRSASCSFACPASGASTTRTTAPNASTWTPDGWLRTGDLAYLDEDGFVYISGRIKDMIIRGGNNIYATDVEAVILEHVDVQEAAVVGVPHQVFGEDVGAFVVRKPGATLDRGRADRVLRRKARRLQAPAPPLVHRRAPPQHDGEGDEAQAAGHGGALP